jgi:hypothetical protein
MLPNGATIGLPRTFLFESPRDVMDSGVRLQGNAIDWNSQSGEAIKDILVPSGDHMNFVIGKHEHVCMLLFAWWCLHVVVCMLLFAWWCLYGRHACLVLYTSPYVTTPHRCHTPTITSVTHYHQLYLTSHIPTVSPSPVTVTSVTLTSHTATSVTLTVTQSPVSPSPVTQPPVSPSPVTHIPVSPSPVTHTPVSPSPVTHTPVSPLPVTCPPVSPSPVSPSPMCYAHP